MIRNKKNFSEFGNISQSKTVQAGETAEIFNLEIPKNYIGFLYYLANDYFPLKLNIDGEEVPIEEIIAPINSPKLFDPPFVINKFIKVSAKNETAEPKTISFYADGIAYSVLTISEETFINEIKTKMSEPPPTLTEERRPTTAHMINHNIKANVWTEIKLPRDMEAWQMSCRDNYDVLYCFEPSVSTYKTLKAGATVSEDTSPNTDINAIYVRCNNDTIIEIELWKV